MGCGVTSLLEMRTSDIEARAVERVAEEGETLAEQEIVNGSTLDLISRHMARGGQQYCSHLK